MEVCKVRIDEFPIVLQGKQPHRHIPWEPIGTELTTIDSDDHVIFVLIPITYFVLPGQL